jgi:predicted ATP-grasp superfamily ATP-dependent carboligase
MPTEWVDDGPSVLAPGGIVLSSFPSAGLAATVAASYIVRSLNLPRIGVVDQPDGPGIAIVQSGRVQPPVRVHGRSDLAVLLSELPVAPGNGAELARAILGGAERRKARLILSLEGVVAHPPVPEQSETPETVWAAIARPDPGLLEQLKRARVRPLEDGIIGGVSGALLVGGIRRTIPVATLLVSARDSGYPDHRAGAVLIETLDRLLPELRIDTGPLRTQAEVIEQALRAAMRSHPRQPPEEGAPSPTEPPIYG